LQSALEPRGLRNSEEGGLWTVLVCSYQRSTQKYAQQLQIAENLPAFHKPPQ
jgi:hypothetical protein